jgi:hypothetical protein
MVWFRLRRLRDSLEILESDAERLARVSDPALTGAYHFWMAHTYNRVGDFPAARTEVVSHVAVDGRPSRLAEVNCANLGDRSPARLAAGDSPFARLALLQNAS